MILAAWLVFFAKFYAGIGVFVAALFIFYGIDRIDPGARGAYSFRPLLVPGAILLWPLVLWRWISLERGER